MVALAVDVRRFLEDILRAEVDAEATAFAAMGNNERLSSGDRED